jgi:hypothetical protein
MWTLRDYPVTHCDDRHQATGGPIRGFAIEEKVGVHVPIAPGEFGILPGEGPTAEQGEASGPSTT